MATNRKRPTKAEKHLAASLSALVKVRGDLDEMTDRHQRVTRSRDEISDELTGLKRELEMMKRSEKTYEKVITALQDDNDRLTNDNRSFFSLLKSERESGGRPGLLNRMADARVHAVITNMAAATEPKRTI
jgi:chromosome segregation ATPase